MCVNCLCLLGLITLLDTKIEGKTYVYSKNPIFIPKILTRNLKLQNNIPIRFTEENKHTIYRDIKNFNDHKPHSANKLMKKYKKLPDSPSLYLEPPKLLKKDKKNKQLHLKKKKKAKYNVNVTTETSNEKKNQQIRPAYERDHAPSQDPEEETSETKTKEDKNKIDKEKEPERNRIDFHIHNHEGPDTYIFGFDTGDGDNRQFRMEERHENGTVTGHYGYYDARGKLRKIFYSSKPSLGYTEDPPISTSDSR